MPVFGFQAPSTLNDGSSIKKKWSHVLWAHKNPYVMKDTAGLDNAANPYYGYTAIPHVSNQSSSTYFDIRLGMLNNSDSVVEDNYLVTYYSSRYSYFPIAYWVKWDVILLIWSTRSIGMRRAVLKYNGGTSFTVIASAATIFSHTGSYDYNDWIHIRKDANGALHILYPYRGSTAKLKYYYFNNDGEDGTEYQSGYWATANFQLGKEWSSGPSPAFGGLSTTPQSTFMNIIDDTLIIGGISPQASNIVNIKVTHKSLATAYNSWPSSWTIETSTLPDESGSSSNKWRHLGPGTTAVVQGSNGSTFGDARYLMYAFGRIYYSSNYYAQFMVKFTLDSAGAPTAYDWSGGDLGFMLDSSSGINTGPLINDGKSCRPMGLFPVYPAGFVHLYTDRASIQDTDGRTLQAVRWTLGSSNDNNATINSDPSRIDFPSIATGAASGDNSSLMIEAGSAAAKEVEHLIHDVASWGQFNQQHSEMRVSTPGTYNIPDFATHPAAGSYFADHGPTTTDGKGTTYYVGKQNKTWLWSSREQLDTTDKFLRHASGHFEYNFTTSPGSGNEAQDSEIYWPLDRETTHAAKGACVLNVVAGFGPDISFTLDYSDDSVIEFTIDGLHKLKSSVAALSTSNHCYPSYIRCVAFIDGDEPGTSDRDQSLDLWGGTDFWDDMAGETGMVPLSVSDVFEGTISWSIASAEPIKLFCMFYDGRRLPVMGDSISGTSGYKSGQYHAVFDTHS